MRVEDFRRELLAIVDEALVAAERSPDVRDQEPLLVQLVQLIREQPAHQALAEEELVALSRRMASTPPPLGAVELLGYTVHEVELPGVIVALEGLRAIEGEHPIGRAWERARRVDRVLEARHRDWEDRELFASLDL